MIDREWRMRHRQAQIASATRRLEASATALDQGRLSEARELAASARRTFARVHEWDGIWADVARDFPTLALLCESATCGAPVLLEAVDSTGLHYRVQIVRAGTSVNGNRYGLPVLHEAAGLYNLVPVFLNRGKDHDMAERGAGAIAARIKNPKPNAAGIEGILAILPGRADVAGLLEYAHEHRQATGRDLIGLSHVIESGDAELEPLQPKGWLVKKITRVSSVDIVLNPAAGGGLLPLAA